MPHPGPWNADIDWSAGHDSDVSSVGGSSVDLLEQILVLPPHLEQAEEFVVRRRGPTEELIFVQEESSYETVPPSRPVKQGGPMLKRSLWLFLLVSCFVYWGRPDAERSSASNNEQERMVSAGSSSSLSSSSSWWSSNTNSNVQLARPVPKSLRYRSSSSTTTNTFWGPLCSLMGGAVLAMVLLFVSSLVLVAYRQSRWR